MSENKFKCKHCSKQFNSFDSLSRHSSRTHNIKREELYTEIYLNGKKPTCACGCGEPTKFHTTEGFGKYLRGHVSRVNNNWGHNQAAKDKSAETRRRQYKNGEREVWNKGLTKDDSDALKAISEKMKKENNPKRAKQISKSLKGRKHSKEHRENHKKSVAKYWAKQENRDAARERRSKYKLNNKSKLEIKFEKMLKAFNFKFNYQFLFKSHRFDFYLPDYNILIEVDGDWWHCNPKKYKPIHESQLATIKNDKKKNQIAKDNNYKLIRFWEDDINNNIDYVIKILLEIKSN